MTQQEVQRLIDKWITPATLMAIIGGIIWGVQLNALALRNSEQVAALIVDVKAAERINAIQNEALARTAVLLDGLERRVSRIENHDKGH